MFVLVVLNLNVFHAGQKQIVLVRPPGGDKSAGPNAALQRPLRSAFPKKIWQTWKVNPLDFEERDLNNARSWTRNNPDWRYEVITDGNEMEYVEFHFGPEGFNRPDIVEFYRGVQAAIIKADLLRYLIMYAEGGIYADIDVEALKPMWKFIPERYEEKDIDMVVGVEIDEPDWKDHPILGPKSMSFCQWTFMCKPQLPVMMHLIEHIMKWLTDVADGQNRTISDVELDFDEVISGSRPLRLHQRHPGRDEHQARRRPRHRLGLVPRHPGIEARQQRPRPDRRGLRRRPGPLQLGQPRGPVGSGPPPLSRLQLAQPASPLQAPGLR